VTFDPATYEPRDDLLQDRIILVTGAGDGIGRAASLRFASLGARVILLGRTVRKLESVYDEILAGGGLRPSIAPMDFETADGDAYSGLADSIAGEFGRLDGLLHNAGILGELTPIEHYDVTLWQRVLHVNLTAEFILTRVCLPLLRQSDDASILFTSSGVGRRGRAYWGAYAVSKFGVEGLAQVLAQETEKAGIRVNCVNPGATRTSMRLHAYPAEDRDKLKRPDEVITPHVFLMGPDSRGVTGGSFDSQ
jgi:NAD(P)-dependent dehydrogenase (short-subunit alcohol dehydrogenase family)